MSQTSKYSISVIGLGIVGLTTAVGFALKGHEVIGIDIDPEKVRQINEKICPTYEIGLSQALSKVQIKATTDHRLALGTDISFLCGGTPPKADGSIDLYFLEVPAKQLADVLRSKRGYHTVVVRSTVVPGTTEKTVVPFFKDMQNVGICINPEFLREGTALEDFLEPSRIVIGANETRVVDIVKELYQDFKKPILQTDFKTAEMIKQASNAYLATRISFINEVGNTCREMGIDIYEVAKGMGYDERIGSDYLRAGVGYGGFCLPKDLSALISRAKELGYRPRLLEAVQQLNDEQPRRLLNLLKKHIPHLKNRNIGILGLSFKPGTDDVRKSKAIEIMDLLIAEGAKVRAYDPQAMKTFRKVYPNHAEYTSAQQVLESEAVLILTEWEEFNNLDYRNTVVIDGRRIMKAKEARVYEGICW